MIAEKFDCGSWGQSVTVQQLLDGSKDCLSAADENVELASPFLCKNGYLTYCPLETTTTSSTTTMTASPPTTSTTTMTASPQISINSSVQGIWGVVGTLLSLGSLALGYLGYRRAKKGKCALHMAGKIDNGRIELGIIGNLIELDSSVVQGAEDNNFVQQADMAALTF